MVTKATFVDFRGAIAPIAPPPGSAPDCHKDHSHDITTDITITPVLYKIITDAQNEFV